MRRILHHFDDFFRFFCGSSTGNVVMADFRCSFRVSNHVCFCSVHERVFTVYSDSVVLVDPLLSASSTLRLFKKL